MPAEADAEMKARGKTGLTSDDSADDSEPMARRPAIQEFTGGKTANKRGLLLKEKAAARKLEKAEERLRAVEQSSGRARRALSRRSAQPASRPGRAPVSGSDSEVQSNLLVLQLSTFLELRACKTAAKPSAKPSNS